MPDTVVKATVTGDSVRVGDGVTVGGIPHRVVDVCEVPGNRKRLQFADGNSYVMARHMRIDITRAADPSDHRPHIVRRPGGSLSRYPVPGSR
jgi:hypothetical protein